MKFKLKLFLILFSIFFIVVQQNYAQDEDAILKSMHSISSHTLFDYVKELCREKYDGRLTGTCGYNLSAKWVTSILKKWGVKPAGDKGTFLQEFKNPYTLVLPGSFAILHMPINKKNSIKKFYRYEKDFIPGSTSGSGEVTAEVIYVGYGITAPELGYDDYKGVNVKGKIVLMEREVPISPYKNPEEFKKWRPYSFHQYKVKNAKKHGAAGMLYNYHIANPNCLYIKDLILTYIGKTVLNDLFIGTKLSHKQVIKRIRETKKPYSFRTKKRMSIKNVTEHHPEGIAYNVLGIAVGSDPVLKKEIIVLSAHLDHMGRNHELMPGADDNCSGVSVILGVAEALSKLNQKPKRSILFIFFGAEEQGVKGSEYFLKHPTLPGTKIINCINLDGVGRGNKITAIAAKNYPELWKPFEEANSKYIHRILRATLFSNIARPRLDAAHFMWAGIPTISLSTHGLPLGYSVYHKTLDKPELLTPEIMEDLAQLIFLSIITLAND